MINRVLAHRLALAVVVLMAPLMIAYPVSARTNVAVFSTAPSATHQQISDDLDYPIANGWFYTQTGGGDGTGYAVLDAGTDANGQTIKFWTVFERLGGVATLGYPVSQLYIGGDGFTYQAFQGGILQWRPELADAVLANTFDMLESAGRSDWLTNVKGLPTPISDDGSDGDFQKAVDTRMGWLTEPAIKEKVLANPNPQVLSDWNDALALQLFGLPKSKPEQHGPFISQLFQRISVQLWTEEVAGMPAPGSVTVVLGGDLVKEAGLIPTGATQVLGPGGTAPDGPASSVSAATPANSWVLRQTLTKVHCGPAVFRLRALDANGLGVNGLIIRSWNDGGNVVETTTRSNSGFDGYMDRVVSEKPVNGKWYVQMVDAAHQPSSNLLTINFTDNCHYDQQSVNEIALELRQESTAETPPQPGASDPAPATASYPWRATISARLPSCSATVIRAFVVDSSGQGLNGYGVKTWNDQGGVTTITSANHHGVDGYAERLIGTGVVPGLWHLILVDAAGNQASNVVNVTFSSDDCRWGTPNQQVEITIRPS